MFDGSKNYLSSVLLTLSQVSSIESDSYVWYTRLNSGPIMYRSIALICFEFFRLTASTYPWKSDLYCLHLWLLFGTSMTNRVVVTLGLLVPSFPGHQWSEPMLNTLHQIRPIDQFVLFKYLLMYVYIFIKHFFLQNVFTKIKKW